jgi:CRP-like cAMP-binding protein
LPHVFQLVVVATATVFLVRRLGRRQSAFAEETLARRLVANWKWTDAPPPQSLREAFLIHTIRSQSQDDARRQMLDLYKSAIRDSLDSGMISRREVHRLDALRHQLQISDADHELAMSELADEGGGLAASQARVASPEKQLQLDTYAEALQVHLERQHQAPADVDNAFVRELRARYGVTVDEHAAVVERLLQGDGLASHLTGVPAAIEWLAATVRRFETVRSPAARFLLRLLRRRWARASDSLVRTLAGDVPAAEALREGLMSDVPEARDMVLGVVGSLVSASTATALTTALTRARDDLGDSPDAARLLRAQLSSPEPYIRASAIYLLEGMDQANDADFDRLEADEHPVVRETATFARALAAGAVPAAPATLEKMIGLRSIGIFDDLEPEDLAQLARAGTEVWFTQGECLCREGEAGDEVYVLLDGEVSVSHAGAVTTEGPGGCIGELAVLDPAPHEATVVACTVAVRTLRLTGGSFRQALGASPVVSEGIIRSLARRLRAKGQALTAG